MVGWIVGCDGADPQRPGCARGAHLGQLLVILDEVARGAVRAVHWIGDEAEAEAFADTPVREHV
eukprot:5009159-Prymnesium_polylepis.1